MPGWERRLPCDRSLLRNRGEQFEDVSDQAGEWFERPILGRGLAVGDLDETAGLMSSSMRSMLRPQFCAIPRTGEHSSRRRDRSARADGRGCACRITAGGRDQVGPGGGRGQLSQFFARPSAILAWVPRKALTESR